MITSPADLHESILEFGRADPDPGSVADKVLATVTDLSEAMIIAKCTLRDYVRHVLSTRRRPATESVAYTKGGQATASARVAATIDWYETQLRHPMFVNGAWKTLGDCTADDLTFAVEQRRQKAADTLAEAERLARLRDATRNAKAATVRALDPEIGKKILST